MLTNININSIYNCIYKPIINCMPYVRRITWTTIETIYIKWCNNSSDSFPVTRGSHHCYLIYILIL